MITPPPNEVPDVAVGSDRPQDKVSGFQSRVQTLGRTAGAIGLFAYVIGLVTVNAYLLNLGVSDFSLLRARFVYAGTLVILSVVIISAFSLLARLTVEKGLESLNMSREKAAERDQKKGRPIVPWWVRAVPIFGYGLVIAAFTPIMLFTIAMRSGDSWAVVRHALVLWGAGFVTVAVISAASKEFRRSGERLAEVPVTAVFLAGYVVVFLLIFARFVYPAVPEQFGGGRSRPARLVVDAPVEASLTEIGLPFTGGRPVSECVDVLFVADDTYVVGLADGAVLQVDKTVVDALVINPRAVNCPAG
jgi:hypothetical protein